MSALGATKLAIASELTTSSYKSLEPSRAARALANTLKWHSSDTTAVPTKEPGERSSYKKRGLSELRRQGAVSRREMGSKPIVVN